MELSIANRISRLRNEMRAMAVDAIIVPSNDPHFSEYIADYWKCREWISGFTGSAGTVVFTLTEAALWTDSRYFIQAETQLAETGIELQKLKMPGTPTIDEWLQYRLPIKGKVAINGNLFTLPQYQQLQNALPNHEVKLIPDLFQAIWEDRPILPVHKIFLLGEEYTGASRSEKFKRVRDNFPNRNFVYLITALDEIAWLFNIRGNDVECNPVALSYAILTNDVAYLFINPEKLVESDVISLEADGVIIKPYSEWDDFLAELACSQTDVIYHPQKLTIQSYQALELNGAKLFAENNSPGIISNLKAVKNTVELQGFRRAMIADGVAIVRILIWLYEHLGKITITERSFAQQLYLSRSQQHGFIGDSFAPIVAYGPHGAAPHYSATPESDAEIFANGFLLFDTGAQYLYGTTDITRTLHLGKPTQQEKTDYTMVLKGMINLSKAKFPAGTRGAQLDALARVGLWSQGTNYLHGTGHGVGHFLNVHEGPQSIRMEENPVILQKGMVTSNEPALYREGEYGIRTENLIACTDFMQSAWGEFYQFETLTLCPIDTKPIDKKLLTTEEIDWLNGYHSKVYAELSPHLSKDENEFLATYTQEI